ncbi:MAG: transglycosylase domain-containing protein [Patulibacter minatonensis]
MSTRRTRIRHRNRRRGSSRLVIILFGSLLALGGVAAASILGWVIAIASTGPDISDLTARQNGRSSQVFAADGTSLGFIQSTVVRQEISSDQIPEDVRNATVAVEDRRFYQHKGVDFEGVVRAGFANVTNGGTVQGGSTLTMQLIKNLYASNERNITRKIREAKLAEELENVHPGREGKRWILDKYLNNVSYGAAGGQEVLGIQAAARAYYNKPARNLSLSEAAMIAGLPQAPSQYNPLLSPEKALARRNDVLRRMRDQGMITASQYEAAAKADLGVHPSRYYSTRTEGYVFDYVKKQLTERYGEKAVREGGLKVYTTIDLKLQRAARKAIAQNLTIPDPPSSAIVTMDPATGQIKAMATSANYGQRKFNFAAQGRRQPGSTAKTFVLMAAVRRGVRPDSTSYVSKPLNITSGPYGSPFSPLKVKTYDGSYGGSMNLTTATLKSDNSVYMQLAIDLGIKDVEKAAVDMGIPSRALHGHIGEALGGFTSGITPLEAATAYSTIANGGYRNTPTLISRVRFPKSDRYPNGKTFDLGHPKRAKTFQNGVTGEVTRILEKNVQGGTGTKAQIQCPAAGKTGTTDNFRDAWFSGFTPRLATSVWVGYPDRQVEMRSQYFGSPVAGGSFPAAIWGSYMKVAVAGKPCGTWRKITEPVTAAPFRGRYSKSGGEGTGDEMGTTPDDAKKTSPGGGNGVDGGGTTKKPGSGGGNGGGNGTQGGLGGGTAGGGTAGGGGGTGGTGGGGGTPGGGGIVVPAQ